LSRQPKIWSIGRGRKAEEEGGWEDGKMRSWAKSETEGWGDWSTVEGEVGKGGKESFDFHWNTRKGRIRTKSAD